MPLRVALLNPPSSLRSTYGPLWPVGNLVQPLGLGYLAAVLEAAGHEVRVLDASCEGLSEEEAAARLSSLSPDLLLATAATPDFPAASRVAARLRAEGVPAVVGGPHASAVPEDGARAFDAAVVGEGEATALELASRVERGLPLAGAPGTAVLREGGFVLGAPRPPLDLDALPFPARHLLPPLSAYRPTPATYRRRPVGTMVSARGCPHRCTFCDRSVFGSSLRLRSASGVADELEHLAEAHGAREVRVWDDTFNASRRRVLEVCAELERRGLDVPWTCLCRADGLDAELARRMRRAGCWQVSLGVESGDPAVLAATCKGVTLDEVRSAVAALRGAGVESRGFFMLGLPGDTEGSMERTVSFALELGLDVAQFYVAVPYPGSEMASAAGLGPGSVPYEELLPNMPRRVRFRLSEVEGEGVRRAQIGAYLRFYLRPSYLAGRLPGVAARLARS